MYVLCISGVHKRISALNLELNSLAYLPLSHLISFVSPCTLTQTTRVGNGVVIGADVTVGENSEIKRSVIGDGCRIGANVLMEDSYVWSGTEVEDGARLTGAVLASRAMAKSHAGAARLR